MKLFKLGFLFVTLLILIHNSVAQDFGILEPSAEILETGFDNRSLAMGKTTTITSRTCESCRAHCRSGFQQRQKFLVGRFGTLRDMGAGQCGGVEIFRKPHTREYFDDLPLQYGPWLFHEKIGAKSEDV